MTRIGGVGFEEIEMDIKRAHARSLSFISSKEDKPLWLPSEVFFHLILFYFIYISNLPSFFRVTTCGERRILVVIAMSCPPK